jgi:hypothetical protein
VTKQTLPNRVVLPTNHRSLFKPTMFTGSIEN